MGAATLLHDLLSRGLALSADGDKLRVRGKLTDDDRGHIRARKPELLAALAAQAVQAARSVPIPGLPAPSLHVACSACLHLDGERCIERGFYPIFPHIAMRFCGDYEVRP